MKVLFIFLSFVIISTCQLDKWHTLSADAEPLYSDAPGAQPKGRRNAAAWCTDNDEIYIFGGKDENARLSDLWRYEEASDRWIWIMNTPLRALSGMAYWSSRSDQDLWIYGGRDDAGNVYDDLWKYTRATRTWELQQFTGGPGPRFGAAFWYRPVASSLYLYGGKSNTSFVREDMWSLDVRALEWTLLKTTNDPGAIDDAQAALSSSTGKAYIFGGEHQDDTLTTNALWELDLETITWNQLQSDGGPSAREDLVMWFDVSQHSLFIFGGKTNNRVLGETWRYDIETSTWTETQTSETTPSPRWGTTVCTDDEGYAFLFGGTTLDQGHMHNDVWKYGQIYSRPFGGLFDNLDRLTSSSLVAAGMSSFLVIGGLFALIFATICWCIQRKKERSSHLNV